ncbi:MBL fold metallo-hydrolase [Haliea atlantica]
MKIKITASISRAMALTLSLLIATSPCSFAAPDGDVEQRVDDLTRLPVEATQLNDFIYKIDGQGAIFLVNTSEGSVLIDVGFNKTQGLKQKALAEKHATGPIRKIILTHFHTDHVGALPVWNEEVAGGLPIVAHQRYPYMARIQRELNPFFNRRYEVLYGDLVNSDPDPDLSYWAIEPDRPVYVGQPYTFALGEVDFEVIAMDNTGEGEDGLMVWLPKQKILFVGDMFGPLYPMFPNLYTVRGEKYRDALDYIDALDQILALEPEMLVSTHFTVERGAEQIRSSVTRMRDAVQYVWDEVVAGMNAGKTVWQLMDEISLPEEYAVSQGHGKVSWSVRAIWETVAGWYHYDTVANLYPVSVESIYDDVVAAAGGTAPLVEQASQRLAADQPVQALRLLDMTQGSPTVDSLALRIRVLDTLLEQAQALRNYSEIGLLKDDRQRTASRLEALGS